MILTISSSTDEHARAVMGCLEARGAQATLLDLSQFPTRMALALKYSGNGSSAGNGSACRSRGWRLRLPDGDWLDFAECRSIWWRRPQPFSIHPEIRRGSHQHFALNEAHEAFLGLWQGLDAFWMNPPRNDEMAHRKAYQLRVAQDLDLRIPETLITSDEDEARRFLERRGPERTICKAFSATEAEWRETRLVRDAELSNLEAVRFAPVIFQEYVEADVDLRITVVGDEIFPAAVHSQETSYKVDFRMDIGNARISAESLPDQVEAQLRALMSRLGLVYGAIDMRRTPEGEHVFLEINPAGQWLFIEQVTGQKISEAIAARLAVHDAGAAVIS